MKGFDKIVAPLISILKIIIAKSINVVLTINKVVYTKNEKKVETKVESQTSFVFHPVRLVFVQLS